MVEHKSIKYFQTFFEVSQTILSSLSLKDILNFLVKSTVGVLDVKAGSLRLVNEETNLLELVASHLLSKKYLDKGPLSSDQSIPEVLDGKVAIIKDAFKDPRIQYKSEKIEEGIAFEKKIVV